MSERPTNLGTACRKSAVVALLFLACLVSGCGTLHTYGSYNKYSKCVEECKKLEDETAQRKCSDRCYKDFDWSRSPVLDHMPGVDNSKPRAWYQPKWEVGTSRDW